MSNFTARPVRTLLSLLVTVVGVLGLPAVAEGAAQPPCCVTGNAEEHFYTDDHYASFVLVDTNF